MEDSSSTQRSLDGRGRRGVHHLLLDGGTVRAAEKKILLNKELKRNLHLEEDNFIHLGGTGTNTRAGEFEIENGVTAIDKVFGTSLNPRVI